jgi:hypothetical protein
MTVDQLVGHQLFCLAPLLGTLGTSTSGCLMQFPSVVNRDYGASRAWSKYTSTIMWRS